MLRNLIEERVAIIRRNPSLSEETAIKKILECKIDTIIEYIDNMNKKKDKKNV